MQLGVSRRHLESGVEGSRVNWRLKYVNHQCLGVL